MPDKQLPTWVNGQRHETLPAGILPLNDRGLAYGDGVFETIAIVDREPRLLSRHLDRLFASLAYLGIPLSTNRLFADLVGVLTEVESLPESQPLILKIIVTAGCGSRGYRRSPARANCIMQLLPAPVFPASFNRGIHTELAKYRLPHTPALAGLKHLNRLDQVLASSEFRQGVDELLLCSEAGDLVEGSRTNVFLVSGGCLFTPLLDRCGVSGVLRRYLLEDVLPSMQLAVVEKRIKLSELLKADEVFVCNSVVGLWPVRSVGVHRFGEGAVTAAIVRYLAQKGFGSPDV